MARIAWQVFRHLNSWVEEMTNIDRLGVSLPTVENMLIVRRGGIVDGVDNE